MKKPLLKSISFAEHPSDIVAHAVLLTGQSKRFSLITSVAIEGGAAREVGSLAIVDEDGHMTGYLSNGCIDKDIQLHAIDALRSGIKKLIRYGDGSQFADLTLPCGGALSLLIDPQPDLEALSILHTALEARQTGSLKFHLPGDSAGTVSFNYAPQFRLVLAGRGAIFRSMAQVGHSVGFQICGLSPDEEDLEAIWAISEVSPVHLTSPKQVEAFAEIDQFSAFLTLFHDHEWEPELLRAALGSSAHYIGCLGSRRTHEARVKQLISMGVAEGQFSNLHGPIGLVPSLRDAPLIAISTLAEIVSKLPPSITRCSAL
jgi:xanthine dehydrogenase accessory factor